MVCKLCGVDIPEGATVCPACGAEIEAPKKEEVVELFEEPKADAVYTNDPGKTLGLWGMIIGIVSVVSLGLCCCVYGSVIPLIVGIVGIILSAIAMKKSKKAGFKNGKGLAGLIMSIVSTVLAILTVGLLILGIVGGLLGGIIEGTSDYDDYGAYNDYSYSDYYSY